MRASPQQKRLRLCIARNATGFSGSGASARCAPRCLNCFASKRNDDMANQQRTDAGLRELALFAGAGGGILGGKLLGWRTVCAVEWEPYPASVLCARQNDGILPPFPIWDDVQTFDGRPWRGIVDVVSGGFPCQDISSAGRGAGIDGEKSSMWRHMARIIGEVRPQYAYIENSPMLTLRGLDRVLADLAALGFDADWGVVSAADVGAPHLRERIWIVANARGGRRLQSKIRQMEQPRRTEAVSAGIDLADTASEGLPARGVRGGVAEDGEVFNLRPFDRRQAMADASGEHAQGKFAGCPDAQEWSIQGERPPRPRSNGSRRGPTKSRLGGMDDELADRLDIIGAIES